ncbi:hypothetical protein MTO96_045296 [Rhipicephalus appendiculatus]
MYGVMQPPGLDWDTDQETVHLGTGGQRAHGLLRGEWLRRTRPGRLGGVEDLVLAIPDRTAPDSEAVRLFTGLPGQVQVHLEEVESAPRRVPPSRTVQCYQEQLPRRRTPISAKPDVPIPEQLQTFGGVLAEQVGAAAASS